MNIQLKSLILIVLFLSNSLHADLISEECIEEPIFNGKVCIYKTTTDSTKKSILLIHGIGDNASKDWNNQIKILSKEYQVFSLDLPGFGDSSKGIKNYSPDAYVDLIEFVSNHYKLNKFDLVGHSLGGAISILYSAKHPDKINRLVTVDVAGILQRVAIGKFVASRAIDKDALLTDRLESYLVKFVEKFEKIYAYTEEKISSKSEKIKAGLELIDYNFGPILDKVKAPTLIIWGENDNISPLRTASVLHSRIDQAQLKIISNAGHTPMQDQSSIFNETLLDFLSSTNQFETEVENPIDSPLVERADCYNQSNFYLKGSYEYVNINKCKNVLIEDAQIVNLSIFESRVVIKNSKIGSDVNIALNVIGSDIKITNSEITGEIAINSDRSRLDLAAVDFYPSAITITALGLSRIIFSVCRIYTDEQIKHVHESSKLEHSSIR